MAVTTLIFFGTLVEGHTPQTNAWITGLGAICVIGTLVDSAYTLALVWTGIEALVLYSYLKNQGQMTTSQGFILSILVRLTGPLLVIYISLVNSISGVAPFLTELPSSAAPILLAAGVVGFGGWFLTPKISEEESSAIRPRNYLSRTPAILGLLMITRAAQIFAPGEVSPVFLWVGTILFFLLLMMSLLINQTGRVWEIGGLILFISAFVFADPEAVLVWGMVFLMPGLVLFRNFDSKRTASLALIVGGLGVFPLPFFPSWVGLVSLIGIPSLFFSALVGIFLGRIINRKIQDWRKIEIPTEQISPLTITGYAVILVAQYSIAFQAGLVNKSLAISSIPVGAWLSALLFGVTVLFWDRIPEMNISPLDRLREKTSPLIKAGASSIPRLADETVYLLTRLFEGDGGLIWTLLLGFMIIALISVGGG